MITAALLSINLAVAVGPAVTCGEVQAKAREIAKMYAHGWRLGPIDNGGWTDAIKYYIGLTGATPDQAARWAEQACAYRGIGTRGDIYA